MNNISISDIVISIIAFAIAGYLFYAKITQHPSDKYHNDSWRNRRKK